MGDYCEEEEGGYYTMQASGTKNNGKKKFKSQIFKFENDENPTAYFDFDEENQLIYGSNDDFKKLMYKKHLRKTKEVRFFDTENTIKFKPVRYTWNGPEDCDTASQSAYFFAKDCNREPTGSSAIVGLYDAGTSEFSKDNSKIADFEFYPDGYKSNTKQTLKWVYGADYDTPPGYGFASTFDYCLDYQDTDLGTSEEGNGHYNWFGFDTEGLLNQKEITISFNFKWMYEYPGAPVILPPRKRNLDWEPNGLRVGDYIYNDWFGDEDECVEKWCRVEKTVTMIESDADWNKVPGSTIRFIFDDIRRDGDEAQQYGCFFRFNDLKIEW